MVTDTIAGRELNGVYCTLCGETRERLPAHRAFWFGWYAAHPDTRLVK